MFQFVFFSSAWFRNLAPVLDSLVHMIQEEESVSFFIYFSVWLFGRDSSHMVRKNVIQTDASGLDAFSTSIQLAEANQRIFNSFNSFEIFVGDIWGQVIVVQSTVHQRKIHVFKLKSTITFNHLTYHSLLVMTSLPLHVPQSISLILSRSPWWDL